MTGKVIVSHPNKQHSMQLAYALQESELLDSFVTRLFTTWEFRPFSWFRWLPPKVKETIEHKFFDKTRHYHPKLNHNKIRIINSASFLCPTMLRDLKLVSKQRWVETLYKNSHHFQRKVANMVLRNGSILVCYDGYALVAFSEVRKKSKDTKLILDLSSAHPNTLKKIFNEELEFSPMYKESLNINSRSTLRLFDQIAREVDLADYILAGSSFVRQSCIENNVSPEKIILLPYGSDMTRIIPYTSPKTHGKFRILFVGRIEQRKGIRYLLDAVSNLSLPDIELWLCGNIMGDREALSPYEKIYTHLGYIPHNKMAEIYSQVDVLVFPSLADGFGFVLLEAMAAGIPVITTDHTVGPDIISDGKEGFIIPIRDSQAIAEKILWLKEHRDICLDIGTKARQVAEQYTWQHYYNRAGNIFEKLARA